MSKFDKLLQRMRRNPRDFTIDEIAKVPEHFGFVKRTTSGSHVTFSHNALSEILTVPAHKPIKPIYVKKLLKLIDEVST